MAKATYAPMFETVSGALTKINKKSQHAADQKMVLATHRKAETTSPDCLRVYIRGLESITRKTPVSGAETINRTKFAAVSRAVNDRLHDLTKISQDQAAFQAQKSTGYKTLRSYIWALEAEAYED